MSFVLKNTSAIDPGLLNKLFHHQIGRNIDADIDDMIGKSRTSYQHILDLKEAFDTIRESYTHTHTRTHMHTRTHTLKVGLNLCMSEKRMPYRMPSRVPLRIRMPCRIAT